MSTIGAPSFRDSYQYHTYKVSALTTSFCPTAQPSWSLAASLLLIVDNAPSHIRTLACEHYKTMPHGTIECQPPRPPDLSQLDFFLWNELKAQLVETQAPAKSRRTAGTFDPPESQDVDSQPLAVREHGQTPGTEAGSLRCRKRPLFRAAQTIFQAASCHVTKLQQNKPTKDT